MPPRERRWRGRDVRVVVVKKHVYGVTSFVSSRLVRLVASRLSLSKCARRHAAAAHTRIPSESASAHLGPRAAVLARPLQTPSTWPFSKRDRASSTCPKGSRSGAPTSNTSRWPFCAAYKHVRSSHGQLFSRDHFNTSRWPSSAASHARHLVPRAAVLAQPTSTPRAVAARRRAPAHLRTNPGQHILARPLQHLEVAAFADFSTYIYIYIRRVCVCVYAHVYQFHYAAVLYIYFSTSRWPFSAAYQHVILVPTGSRSRAPTSAPRGGRPPPRYTHTHTHTHLCHEPQTASR